MPETKIIVLDDDPTGSQTVHSCLLLTRWDIQTLREALEDDAPLFFVLTNTRGVDAPRAAELTREVCGNLRIALDSLSADGRPIHPLLVSRSDSTLRGHYPVETDVITEELGPFDAHFLVPAFFEGGRVTIDSVHYIETDSGRLRVDETEFARDSVFSYSTSYLPDYVAEKTNGRILASAVERFLLEDVRGDVRQRLLNLNGNVCCAVDCERQADLDGFTAQVLEAAGRGKRFLFRSGASLLTSLAGLPPQPLAPAEMIHYRRGRAPGVVLVGSHVRKTTAQLEALFGEPDVAPVEVDVDRIAGARRHLLEEVLGQVSAVHGAGRTPVIYTSRAERTFPDQGTRLAFGESVSQFLMELVRGLPEDIGFLISKGGITSNDVLSKGLALRRARVLGQILPGCSVVRCPEDHPRYPGLPVVIFPGNVGDEHGLATVHRHLAGPAPGTDQRPLA